MKGIITGEDGDYRIWEQNLPVTIYATGKLIL
jgi:hypothetical protein